MKASLLGLLNLQDSAPGSTAADADDGGYGGAEGRVPSQPAPEVVRLAAQMVAAAVSQRIEGGQVAALPLEAADKQVGRAKGGWGGGAVGAMVNSTYTPVSCSPQTCVLYCPQHLPQGWEPSYALANMYRDGSAGIGGHRPADQAGPLPHHCQVSVLFPESCGGCLFACLSMTVLPCCCP